MLLRKIKRKNLCKVPKVLQKQPDAMVEMTITGSLNGTSKLPLIEVRPMHQDLCSVGLFDQYKSSVVHSTQQHEYIMSITFLWLVDEELRVEP